MNPTDFMKYMNYTYFNVIYTVFTRYLHGIYTELKFDYSFIKNWLLFTRYLHTRTPQMLYTIVFTRFLTLFTRYLHGIYTVFTRYLHGIYTELKF